MSAQTQLGSFEDPYNYSMPQPSGNGAEWSSNPDEFQENPNGIMHRITDWLGVTDYKGQYERWLTKQNQEYERQSINSARAWEEYMDSTAVQRRMQDLKAAGLNPYLAIQSGVSPSSSGGSTSSGGSALAKNHLSKASSKTNLSTIAFAIAATAKLMAVL